MNTAQTAQSEPPVIHFTSATPNRKPRLYDQCTAHPDVVLIETCIRYVAEAASAARIFEVDPTADKVFAAAFDTKSVARAGRLLTAITETKPLSIDGLRAKASIIKAVLANKSGTIQEHEQDFLTSLADDIVRLQRTSFESGHDTAIIAGLSA